MDHSDTHAARNEAFGYECHRCLNCCRNKVIQLNPYEIARLARNRGLSTTAFRANHTVDGGGTELSQKPDGTCVFLGPAGCTVHSDRPLVCRLYPLGRHRGFDGTERFSRVTPHPRSEGEYHTRSNIRDYVRSQGAEPFIAAADEYLAWLILAIEKLTAKTEQSAQDVIDSPAVDDRLLDMDAQISDHCKATGSPEPLDIEERKRLHLAILNDYLEAL
jgi:uncharacterized protein